MMCRDYIIADNRIRISGPVADIAAVGVGSFSVFATEYSPEENPIVEIETGCEISVTEMESERLTEFNFDEGQALCTFGRTATHYTFRIENEHCTPLYIIYDRQTDRVQCNAGANGVCNPSFLRFGLWFAVGIAASKHQTAAIHTSVIVANNEAVMFLGESGTGKSTHGMCSWTSPEDSHAMTSKSPSG